MIAMKVKALGFAAALAFTTQAAARAIDDRSVLRPMVLSRVAHDTYGCVDARAALSLTDPGNPKRMDPMWKEVVSTRGQCVELTPYEAWRTIRHQGPLVLLSRARNANETTPLFVRASELAPSFIDVPVNQQHPAEPALANSASSPHQQTTFDDSIAPGPKYGQGFVPEFINSNSPKQYERSSGSEPLGNKAKIYADAMDRRATPWVFMITASLLLAFMVAGWALLRNRHSEASWNVPSKSPSLQ